MTTLLALLLLATTASAQDPSAELNRLESEMRKLSQRNVWAGVDRSYIDAVELGVPLGDELHWLGAQAALNRGEMLTAWYRIQRLSDDAPATEPGVETPQQQARGEAEQLQRRYGLVALSVAPERVAAVTRAEMPFAQRERDAIAYAREQIRVYRAFRGLLPIGTYRVDTVEIEVVEGLESWQVFVVE